MTRMTAHSDFFRGNHQPGDAEGAGQVHGKHRVQASGSISSTGAVGPEIPACSRGRQSRQRVHRILHQSLDRDPIRHVADCPGDRRTRVAYGAKGVLVDVADMDPSTVGGKRTGNRQPIPLAPAVTTTHRSELIAPVLLADPLTENRLVSSAIRRS